MSESTAKPTASLPPSAIIMAAGKGTRMGGDLAKVLHPVQGRPMVCWVVDACKAAGVQMCVVIVGYQADAVKASLKGVPGVVFSEQKEQLGTGHAARMAEPHFQGKPATDVFVLAGDGPLIRVDTLRKLLDVHRKQGASATLATAVLNDPSGYGRVLRNADGGFKAIVEQKDATPEQLKVNEVNPSYYCFRSDDLFASLGQVKNDNKQREYYLTDAPTLMQAKGKRVAVVDAVPPEDVLSINTPEQLAEVDAILGKRLKKK